MPIVQWKESYSLNNLTLDNQHKKFLCILNRLYDDFMEGVNELAYENAVDNLVAYTDYHFQTEESIMCKIMHKNYYGHMQEHKKFTEKVRDLKETIEHGSKDKTKDLIEFLVNWLLHHVILEDRKIAY